ncbi:hypothetical protein [Geodermatophilus sp. URMC 63]
MIERERLVLDPLNPRLVDPGSGGQPLDAAEAARRLADKHDPLPIGRSMVQFGFFDSDPLIAYEEGDRFVVVEGNRRLLALTLLLDEGFRNEVEVDDAWDDLAASLTEDRRQGLRVVPVQVVADRDEAAPVIGFRHIVGIKKWDAYEKAAFVKQLVARQADQAGSTDDGVFQSVSVLTGESPTRIRTYIRDYTLLKQAEAAGTDVTAARQEFGVFTRALSSRGVRNFIQATGAGSVTVDMETAYNANDAEMQELLSWIYGSNTEEPVFTDARRLRDLGQVLESAEATDHLRKTRNLDEAEAMSGAGRDRFLNNASKALAAVKAMTNDLDGLLRDHAVESAITQLHVAVTGLGPLVAPSSVEATNEEAESDDFKLDDEEQDLVDEAADEDNGDR